MTTPNDKPKPRRYEIFIDKAALAEYMKTPEAQAARDIIPRKVIKFDWVVRRPDADKE